MNVLITLPKHLLESIIAGNKTFEMRKCKPVMMKIGEDGFFVVEKRTDEVKCWCRVDKVIETVMTKEIAARYSKCLCVTSQFILNYAPLGTKVYMWGIGKCIKIEGLCRDSLCVKRNPQSFAYCPLSYGESY